MADFKIGSSSVGLKVGSSAVSKVYAGSALVWSPPSGTDDWDTYDDGIFHGVYSGSSGNTLTEMTAVSSGSTPTSTNYYTSPTRVRLSGYANATARPAVAIWIPAQTTSASTNASGVWQYYTKATDQTAAGSARTDYEFVKNNSGGTSILPTNRDYNSYLVLLTATSNVEDWTDYDGPIRWEDWKESPSYLGGVYSGSATSVAHANYTRYDGLLDGLVIGTPTTFSYSNATRFSSNGQGTYTGASSVMIRTHGAAYHVWYKELHGWIKQPLTVWYSTTLADYSAKGSNLWGYSSFNQNLPIAMQYYDEDPGPMDNWTDYDGPVANWDTYANGVYVTMNMRTSGTDMVVVPGYDATTYSDTMTGIWLTSVTGGYVPTSVNYIQNYDGDEAPYIAVYIHEYSDDDENIAGSNAKGWYVFKNDTPSSGTYSRTTWETPVAWPSDVSSSRSATANASGYLGSNAGVHYGYAVILLDEYNDPEGSGGTDHWTLPPTVHSDIRTEFNSGANGPGWLADTNANPPNPIYGGKPGSGIGYYHWNPYRGTFLFVRDYEAMGTLTFKAYYRLPSTTTDVFMGEGSYTFTASGNPKQMYFSTNSPFSGNANDSNYIFNTVTYGSRMTLVFEH